MRLLSKMLRFKHNFYNVLSIEVNIIPDQMPDDHVDEILNLCR